MTCSHCGGLVVWVGPLTNLTHSECTICGAIYCQVFSLTEENDNDVNESEMLLEGGE